jgi:hypothetical protein
MSLKVIRMILSESQSFMVTHTEFHKNLVQVLKEQPYIAMVRKTFRRMSACTNVNAQKLHIHGGLLGCDVMWTWRWVSTFLRNPCLHL